MLRFSSKFGCPKNAPFSEKGHRGSENPMWYGWIRLQGFQFGRTVKYSRDMKPTLQAASEGYAMLCCHLNMLGGPFLLQIAVPHAAMWYAIQNHATSIQQTLQQSHHASWYQLFPLTASECQHRSLGHCLTHVT